MKHWIILIIAIFIFPNGAASDTINVRMENFDNHAEITLETESLPPWQVTQSNAIYKIRFTSSSETNFDLSGLSSNFPERDFSILDTEPNELSLDLKCACKAAFFESKGNLIIEISDLSSRPSKMLDRQPAYSTNPEGSLVETASDRMDADAIKELTPIESDAEGRPESQSQQESGRKSTLNIPGIQFSDSLTLDGLRFPGLRSEAIDALSRQFSRASAQGLVEANSEGANEVTQRPQLLEARGSRNIEIETGIDRALLSMNDSPSTTNAGISCLTDTVADVTQWGSEDGEYTFGVFRKGIVAEDGSIDPDGAEALARHYLFLGFGAEASSLAKFITDQPTRRFIVLLSEIMDQRFTFAEDLRDQRFCEGAVSLWGLLSGPLESSGAPEDIAHILQYFSQLPFHLRQQLGPEVSERLRRVGLINEGRNILNAITRKGVDSAESELVAARLGLTGTQAEKARQALVEMTIGNDSLSAEALYELFIDAQARNLAPNPEWVNDYPSLVRATKGLGIANQLEREGLRGMIALGRFQDFRERLESVAQGLGDQTVRELAGEALVASVDQELEEFIQNEIHFAKLANPNGLQVADSYRVAKRLFEIGLAGRAEKYLRFPTENSENLILASKVYEDLSKFDLAIDVLEVSSDLEVTQQIAEVLHRRGNAREAMKKFAEADSVQRATDIAIQKGDWSWIMEKGTDPVKSLAEQINLNIAEEDLLTGFQNGYLLEGSQRRRSNIESLLNLTETPLSTELFTN